MKTAVRYLFRILSVIVFGAIVTGVLTAGGYINRSSDSPDAVSSATAQPVSAGDMSGKYIVFINRGLHDKAGTTGDWEKFFSFTDDVPLIMEDITCKVAQLDSEGLDTARKYQARLPENQMKIEQEAGVMLLSKAELGRFDVMIMSEAAAKSYSAQTLYDKENILTIKM
ncbi:hypothetical protein [Ruminococcus sp.]|uniref:hypothetical protein n=1 Tax=Ruminococcus sp. TaxID=41978 RepID=UPI002E76C21D|nr:hypothetical protein [Ruminococcus sp.]MEE1263344.1 hypothetical protein [Ruminococcus sp.]